MVYALTHLGYSRTGVVRKHCWLYKNRKISDSASLFISKTSSGKLAQLILAVFASAPEGLEARTAMRSDICFVRMAIFSDCDSTAAFIRSRLFSPNIFDIYSFWQTLHS